ncbi:MAG: hypothetical protein HY268_13525 [Deltaproteobacteria bacterium]|nr:hypothetical protein [Deltaproteobacteria bacterium]
MKNKAWLGAVCGAFFLAAAPAWAAIVLTLENPGAGQFISGISTISGWAFAENGASVTITLLVNDALTDIIIPCCAPRADVQASNPKASLNSGFGLLFNYNNFNPLTLKSIGVQITALGEAPVTVNHPVTLAKPGARDTDSSSSLFAVLEQLSPNGARLATDGEEIILAPVTVIDKDSGGKRQSTLRLLWTSSTQSFGVIRAASGTSFDGVQTIFTNRCATDGCHSHITVAGDLDLSKGRAFRRTVAVQSEVDSEGRFRVNPGKSSESYLYQKIIAGGSMITGTRMPPACPSNPNACLSDSDIQTIVGWIDEGAPPQQ